LDALEIKRKQLEKKLATFDPDDARNAILEIQAGTGGDEAALFAGDLCKMYQNYCKTLGLTIEDLDFSAGNMGGVKSASFLIEGEGAYGIFRFESGIHRVQRVPKTETKGRVHTSTVAVVVMPEQQIEQIEINKADVTVEHFGAGGPGGQHSNKTQSAVRLTHVPTGVNVTSRTKSKQANLKFCWNMLASRIQDMQLERISSEVASTKKELRGKASRSEKIRTYNYPDDRVTDHRIEGGKYTLHTTIAGDLEDLFRDVREELSKD
jgi:peptide chain release factor 1